MEGFGDGVQAKEVGLVDELGFPEDASKLMRKDLKLEDAELAEYSSPSSGFVAAHGLQEANWQSS